MPFAVSSNGQFVSVLPCDSSPFIANVQQLLKSLLNFTGHCSS